VFYDETGSIGKRYARMDEIGVPYCATVDHQTLKDSTVTLRDRDSMKQRRVSVKDLCSALWQLMSGKAKFEKIGKSV
jgi:glycyl-tRNA synthetase